MTTANKLCSNCKYLKKYIADDKDWINICEAENPDPNGDGTYNIISVDTVEFNASDCLLYKSSEGKAK